MASKTGGGKGGIFQGISQENSRSVRQQQRRQHSFVYVQQQLYDIKVFYSVMIVYFFRVIIILIYFQSTHLALTVPINPNISRKVGGGRSIRYLAGSPRRMYSKLLSHNDNNTSASPIDHSTHITSPLDDNDSTLSSISIVEPERALLKMDFK